MKIPLSEIQLDRFDILSSEVSYVAPKNQNDEIDEGKYEIDLDYDVDVHEDGRVLIYTHVAVNSRDANYPCHVIRVAGGSIFSFRNRDLISEEEREGYIRHSAMPIAFNNMRGFIENITGYSPLGVFTLPLFTPFHLAQWKAGNEVAIKKEQKKIAKRKTTTQKKAATKKTTSK